MNNFLQSLHDNLTRMPRFIRLPVDWSTRNKVNVPSSKRNVHSRYEAPEGCACEFCKSDGNHHVGLRDKIGSTNPNEATRERFVPISPLPGSISNKKRHPKSNKVLSLSIDYSGDQQTNMSIILRQLQSPTYTSWTGILELIIYPGISRKDAPRAYINHVQGIKDLVHQINISLTQVRQIRCQFVIDHFSFSQLRLAAGFINLDNDSWTLAYVERSDNNKINEIHKRGSVFRRIECAYREDFAN
ncbi:hypothetical protein BCIN_09g05890 [Botrytis cinerea B05.10]|uniref:Uncharacterized protein n=1 Tax=Botryotinia fuckeliana (strain B05.10) TaxID=332648 RepID=A0A384JTV1_BOTFB|nr:hypothetical protein BCIN_09g05890 [Botrytis cinerea B05.10]ATZ53817.1 hypothetical protein BCIN_09g05890 [Botrytis cinerea B05.10]